MNQHITSELVEVIASHEVNRQHATGNHPYMHSWDETPPTEKHRIREAVHANLNAIIPILITEGWATPDQAREYRGIANQHAPTGDAA